MAHTVSECEVGEHSENSCEDLIKLLPKVELHAHLNGSLSKSTLEKLYRIKKRSCPDIKLPTSGTRSLAKCFEVFKVIHNITDSPNSIFEATCDVIQDFSSDGVSYLELRSTPREVSGVMSLQSYVESLVAAVKKCKEDIPNIIVNLLLAIDRKNTVITAEETVKLAEQNMLSNDIVVGVDLSGNPELGNACDFIPALEYAKKAGLKLALHMAEIPGRNKEVECLLQLPPDRIGHGTYLHPENEGNVVNYNFVKKLKIPLEICLTSNIICGTVSSFKDHHFSLWNRIGHPCILCTDDKGVFETSLSNEYNIARKHLGLEMADLWNISFNSINYCFAHEAIKEKLRDVWMCNKNSFIF